MAAEYDIHAWEVRPVGTAAAVQYRDGLFVLRDFSAMLSMIVIALPLLVVAAICWFVAGRIDLKRKIKSWSGERSTIDEAKSARMRILVLRSVAGVCILAAILGAGAVNILSAYAAR